MGVNYWGGWTTSSKSKPAITAPRIPLNERRPHLPPNAQPKVLPWVTILEKHF